MEVKGHIAGAVPQTPSKSKLSQKTKPPENANPNITSPDPKSLKSPPNKSSSKIQKPAMKKLNSVVNPVASPSLRSKIRERKFVVAKKNSKKEKPETPASINCKCDASSNSNKCLCVAYETLRASQDEFSMIGNVIKEEEEEQKKTVIENADLISEFEQKLGESENIEASDEKVSAKVKRRRDKLLEVARQSIPKTGCGRVMHLVKAFEHALKLPKSETGNEIGDPTEELEDPSKKVSKWELPGLRPRAPVTEFSSSDMLLTPESLGLGSRESSCSSGGSQSQGSISKRNSGGARSNRRNSSESSATSSRNRGKRRPRKATPQQPFKLKTEQRGRMKKEEFTKKVQEMMIEQEKQRIRIAQGLPWTTDEPECLARPPTKESTRPIDLVLHSDMRAMERAEFDQQVQEKLSFIEQFKLERERQQKLAEEEELRRLRKELVPKAQPMPYFDRPFVPKRSERQPTMGKEPRFHNPEHKKKNMVVSKLLE